MPLTPEEWLSEFVVASAGGFNYNDSDIVQLSNGNYLISYTTNNDAGAGSPSGLDILGQIYTPLGGTVGSEFRLNTTRSASGEQQSSLTAIDGGGFAMAYVDIDVAGPPGSLDADIVVQVYDNSGNVIFGDVVLNNSAEPGISDLNPKIASASSTNAVIVWYDAAAGDVVGRSYNPSNGNFTSSQFTVFNGGTGTGQGIAGLEITALNNGTYAVAYVNSNPSGTNDEMDIEIISAFGTQIATNQTSFAQVFDPSVTVLTDGKFVVSYTVDNAGGTDSGIRARVYNEDGTAHSGVFNPLTSTPGDQLGSAVAALDGGEFVIFWYDDNLNDILGQRLAQNGAKIGSEFTVEDRGASVKIENLEATRMEDGRVALTWTLDAFDDSVYSAIWDTRDNVNPTPVYDDNLQIGTIGNDVFTIAAGVEEVYAYSGNDTVLVNSTDEFSVDFYGGFGDDTLQMRNPGTFTLTSSVINFFEEFKFNDGAGTGTRSVFIFASAFNQFNTLDFAQSAGQIDRIEIEMGSQTNADYSGLTIQDFVAADDTIIIDGDGNAETIVGTDVNDTIKGGGGLDNLDGHTGTDTVDLSDGGYTGNVTLNMTTGTLSSSQGSETASNFENVIGSSANEAVIGTSGNNEISGNNGNDTITGNDGLDSMYGGNGDDRFIINGTGDINNGVEIIHGGAGTDTLQVIGVGTGAEFIQFTNEDLSSIEEIEFSGSLGGDVDMTLIFSAAQFNSGDISLTALIDGFANSGDNETLRVNLGTENNLNLSGLTFEAWGNQNEIIDINGGTNSDVITGTSQIDDIAGGLGNDVLRGIQGADILNGNNGDDQLEGGSGNDVLNGGDGDDLLFGDTGTDTFDGGAGEDTIDYNTGNSTGGTVSVTGTDVGTAIFGGITESWSNIEQFDTGSGDDIFNWFTNGTTVWTLDGGSGTDLFSVSGSSGQWNIDLGLGTALVGSTLRVNLQNIEDVTGGSNSNTIIGDSMNNTLIGGGGNDFLSGGGGTADILSGGTGDDTLEAGTSTGAFLFGNEGDDTLGFNLGGFNGLSAGNTFDGGDDNDTFDFSNFSSDYAISLAAGTFSQLGGGFTNTLTNIENVDAGNGNDIITGDAGANVLNGGGGNDSIGGRNGDDTLNGDGGDDTLHTNGDGAANILNGGTGTDTWSLSILGSGFSNSNWTIDLSTGNSSASNGTTVTTNSVENVISGSGNDTIIGDTAANVLNGGAGNDTIQSGLGLDSIDAGTGNDIVIIDSANNDYLTGETYDGGAGIDEVRWIGNYNLSSTITFNMTTGELLSGSSVLANHVNFENYDSSGIMDTSDEQVIGTSGANVITTGFGNNDIRAQDGDDILDGGAGDDLIFGQGDNDTLNGGDGADDLRGGLGNDIHNGGDGDDVVNGQAGDDIINGGDGMDELLGASGNDTINGNADNDTINANGGDDNIDGGEGNDDLRGAVGFDNINGGNGDDIVSGGNQNDTINGDAGDDILNGDAGNDIVNGGDDNDTLIGASGQDVLSGDAGNDNLSGDSGGDDLFGGAGDDILDGGGDNDDLNGGAGADIFVANLGFRTDRIQDFEDGIDLIDFSGNVLANDIGDVLAAATQVGANVRIDLNANNTLILENFDLADLDASDFIF